MTLGMKLGKTAKEQHIGPWISSSHFMTSDEMRTTLHQCNVMV